MLERLKYSEEEQKRLMKSMVVLIDSREKKNQHITDYFDKHKIPYKVVALEYGDYSFYIPADETLSIPRDMSFEKEIILERKNSAEELSLCLTRTRARFEEEFIKAKDAKKYLIVENCNYQDIVNGSYDSQYNSKSFLGSIHSFDHKYDLRIVFLPDKSYTPIYIYGVLQYYLRNVVK
jgi:ERCC4-type nuclease